MCRPPDCYNKNLLDGHNRVAVYKTHYADLQTFFSFEGSLSPFSYPFLAKKNLGDESDEYGESEKTYKVIVRM